jgi:pimeloyl-ACP methyl ester carboxylesterase
MAAKPTIVFIPGAWHTPAAFDPLLPSLHQAGYSTTAVSLPSIGVSPGVSSFASDVAAVRDAVEGLVDLRRDVIAVAHSYGGVLVTEALEGLGKKERGAQGLLGGVSRLIYIAAVVPTKGLDTVASNGDIRRPEEGGSVVKSTAHDVG